jgi:hypothetical protein
MNMTRTTLGACLLALPLCGSAAEFLNGEQITATFAGKTAAWQHLKKSTSGRSYTAADGTIVGIKGDDRQEGTWRVDGDKLCVSWGSCLAIEPDGNGGYYKVKGGSKRVVHITSVEDGNTL